MGSQVGNTLSLLLDHTTLRPLTIILDTIQGFLQQNINYDLCFLKISFFLKLMYS